MDYQDCADLLERLHGRPRGLPHGELKANVPRLLAALGSPERALRGMLVVGTNGKGSTCAFAVSAVGASGVRVGSMPSPHLQEHRERIRVDGVPASRTEYAAALGEVWRAVEAHALPVLVAGLHTVTAAVHFRSAGVSLAVAEASIGGSSAAAAKLGLDVKVVTGIGLDHADLLGNSIAEITRAKVTATQRGDHVLLGRLCPEAATTAREVLKERAPRSVWRIGHEIGYSVRTVEGDHGPEVLVDVTTPRTVHHDLPCPLPGAHQHHNLALAVAGMDAMVERGHIPAPDGTHLRERLAATRWPGRLELLPDARLDDWKGQVLLDGATNPQGITTVAPEILAHARTHTRTHPDQPPAVVFSAFEDKDVAAMLAPLPTHWPLVLTRTRSPHSSNPSTMHSLLDPARHGPALTADDTRTALHRAGELAGPDGLIIVIGSLRLGVYQDFGVRHPFGLGVDLAVGVGRLAHTRPAD
ncbi:bifunctional folylpolyglutamate synthase/dihydrofolate synthase, partial [Kitasatospora sp. NPDC059327]|uniref:bifunctional folylpolyglutamate synthase/dihydrofolate synthase n=1 Tax=Kitasatospora sp. NPDC059327 TaxID=3346803 RepID=UPI0036785DA3